MRLQDQNVDTNVLLDDLSHAPGALSDTEPTAFSPDAIASSITEAAAWEWLEHAVRANGGRLLTSIRVLAVEWHWHRSRVERFLSRLRSEARIETVTERGRTAIAIPPAREIVPAAVASAALTATIASATRQPEQDPQDDTGSQEWWEQRRAEGLMIAERQDATIVYRTARNQVAIRTEGGGPNEEDACIVVDPLHAPRLIDRLRAVLDEISRDS